MWRDLTGLTYGPNYYSDYLTPGWSVLRSAGPHKPNKPSLVRLAAAPDARYTARDKNGHLLAGGKFAFHEHDGRGAGGEQTQRPFHQFWFDDNWLARHMARAYGCPEPDGLDDDGGHVRWRVLSGDLNWTPHDRVRPPIRSDQPDRLMLDGLYYLAAGHHERALKKLGKIRATVNPATRLYDYPALRENYHVGLVKILVEQLLTVVDRPELILHSVSLRDLIIRRQQRETGTGRLLGWTSSVEPGGTLMNIESLAVNALALGAGSLATFEPDQTPTLPPGAYTVEFVMRSEGEAAARVDIVDPRSGAALGERGVSLDDRFQRVAVPISTAGGTVAFRWNAGRRPVEVAEIRVR
ncbi:hypothetical protein AB0M54_36320 [Actinoplanes sp. NPDC051470]|uniref:hypothetical protein n=1 Tax=Actinoplanes sp. NPDC051470 TaxID=3157224 RepID=UPI003428E30E